MPAWHEQRRRAMKREASISKAMVGLGSALLLGATSFATNVRAEPKGCSNASLKGSFGFYRNGSTSTGPLAALGILHFDGNGNLNGSQSISRNGTLQFDAPIPLSPYVVNTDCTGRFLTPDGTAEIARLVVTGGGKGFYILSESNGNAVYGVGQKIAEVDQEDCGSVIAAAAGKSCE